MNTIEQIKAELKGKQIIVISENDGIANIKWDCRSLDDVKALLASAQSFITDKQVEELRGIGSGPDYNTTEGRFRNAHKFQQEQPLTIEKVVEQCKKFGGNPEVIQPEVDLKKTVEFECIGKKVKMTVQELINYYIDTECVNVADECGF